MIVPSSPIWIVHQAGPHTEVYAVGVHDVDRRRDCVTLLGSLNWIAVTEYRLKHPPTIDIITDNHAIAIGVRFMGIDAQIVFEALTLRLNIMFDQVCIALNPVEFAALGTKG